MALPIPNGTRIAIPLPPEDEIRSALGEKYNPDALNVTKMLAGTGECFAPTVELVRAIFSAEGVNPKLREMITLRVAKLLNVPYEWEANAKMAANLGLSAKEIDAAASDGPVSDVDEDYVLACKAADELSLTGTLLDDTLSTLLKRFEATTTRKLVLMIGYFNLLGMFLNGCRVPLETSEKIGNSVSPLD